MFSFKRHSIKTGLIISCFFIFSDLNSQCNPAGQLPSVTCDSASTFCLVGYCAETLNEPAFCCNGFCGPNTVINNPQYFRFIAASETVEIRIHVNSCNAGQGLQSAIVTSCEWAPCPGGPLPCPDMLDCDPGTSPGGTMVLGSSNFVIGQPYWLLLDGSNGSVCEYQIDFVSGVDAVLLTGELDPLQTIATPNVVWQGFIGLQVASGPTVGNAHGYYWTFGWNNDTITSSYPALTFDVPLNATPGIWNICVHAFNGCDTTDTEVCVQVEIQETTSTINPDNGSDISIFPNPSNGVFNISLPSDANLPVKWNLYDPQVIEHETGIITEQESSLRFEKLVPGVYFLKLRFSNEQVRVFKIVIE